MIAEPDLARLARTLGEPTRLNMLSLLMEGRALTAKELAYGAGVQPATATEHLKRLQTDGLVEATSQGRHKYFRLATPEVAHAIESLMVVARPLPARTLRRQPSEAMSAARYCYDHVAGRLGTGIAEWLFRHRLIYPEGEAVTLTPEGERWFTAFGIDIAEVRRRRRRFAYCCLDWSERCDHLGGALGAALTQRLQELDWIRRCKRSRAIEISEAGRLALAETFGLEFEASNAAS
ncbi:winged helix-turn-helix transcriptional regulator [Billgrantia pellis]|uniref:Winged helix-turn-helix transcriptional regulator n=1 Tax=Billgrantia pellis TaxID=2606936 RepID=A0A7V7KHX1_9GAMM|nr:winged helix-turn-helix domain-containing protein [Halomonas pellis]KAA0011831.1 winged helix-turn-helix transcriptional regulator [Halomonas pellis]